MATQRASERTHLMKPNGTKAIARREEPTRAIKLRKTGDESFDSKLLDLARDTTLDVAKITALVDAHERVSKLQAEAAFHADFAEMQGLIPIIDRDGRIVHRDERGNVKREMPFATNANIQRIVRPIMKQFGFAIRFSHEEIPEKPGKIRVVGTLSHRLGYFVTDAMVVEADTSGQKNAIQAWGSSRSYGQRYVTRALLNIADELEDDDGAGAGSYERTEGPKPAERLSAKPKAESEKPKPVESKTVEHPKVEEKPTVARDPEVLPAESPNVSRLKSVELRGDAALVTLESGFRAATRNETIAKDLTVFDGMTPKPTVEIVYTPSRDPQKFAHGIVEVKIVRAR